MISAKEAGTETPEVEEQERERWPAGSVVLDSLRALLDLYLVVLGGWVGVGRRCWTEAYGFLRGLPFMQLLFLISCLALILTASPAWISYSVKFAETQTMRIGSSLRILFVLPGLLGIALAASGLRFRLILFLAVYAACAGFYVAGFLFPNPLHTEMVRAEDFHLTIPVYLYALPLLVCGFLSRQGLASPLFDWSLLFIRPEDTEP